MIHHHCHFYRCFNTISLTLCLEVFSAREPENVTRPFMGQPRRLSALPKWKCNSFPQQSFFSKDIPESEYVFFGIVGFSSIMLGIRFIFLIFNMQVTVLQAPDCKHKKARKHKIKACKTHCQKCLPYMYGNLRVPPQMPPPSQEIRPYQGIIRDYYNGG